MYVLRTAAALAVATGALLAGTPAHADTVCVGAMPAYSGCTTFFYEAEHFCLTGEGQVAGRPYTLYPCR